MTGRIIKALSGFYYVYDEESGTVYACRARGVFRKKDLHPLVGDRVTYEVTHEKDREGQILSVFPRKSQLSRPPVANCDMALLVFSVHTPDVNPDLIDRYLVLLEYSGLTPVLVFQKSDLNSDEDFEKIRSIYEGTRYRIIFASALEKKGITEVKEAIQGHVSTVAGPSGAGKSTLLNALLGRDELETSHVSAHTGRGRQTTRHTELVRIADETYVCDTPGFSTVNLPDIREEDLREYFPEFEGYNGSCRFRGCVHVNEPSCAVRDAVDAGKISSSRYQDYVRMYNELKEKNRRSYQ